MKKLLVASAFAFAASVGVAHANTISGELWHVPESVVNSATGATPGNVPGTTPDVTFSVDSPFNFSGSGVSVGTWLASSGAFNIVENTAGTLASLMDNFSIGTILNFTGFVSVTNGQHITVQHDDGLTLIIGGVTVVDEPGPTAPVITDVVYGGPTGNFAFQLVYSECCSGPAVLNISLPFRDTVNDTPLPGTLPLFVSGVGALGVFGWRRRRASRAKLAA